MHTALALANLAIVVVPALGQPVTWTYEGSSAFKAFDSPWPATNGIINRPVTGYHTLGDIRRVRYNCMAVDTAGRVYAACTHVNNNETGGAAHGGGVTIFDPSTSPTTVTNVDLVNSNPPLMGAVMKLVLAGDLKI